MKVEEILEIVGRHKRVHSIIPKCWNLVPAPVILIHKETRISVRVDAVNVGTHRVHLMDHDLWANVNEYDFYG